MNRLFKVNMSGVAGYRVTRVLSSGYIGQGEVVREFEKSLQKDLCTESAPITTNSCTSALDLAYELIGLKEHDEVIVTPQTCFATIVGLIHRNVTIVWADICPITGLISTESVKKLITGKTAAIITCDWAGRLCDYNTLKKFNIPIVEDAAHVWGIDHSRDRGDFVCYSFQAIKFLTSGDGGALVVPESQHSRAKKLRWYGYDRESTEDFRSKQNIVEAGFKYHMNDINATIGMSNLTIANKAVSSNKKVAKQYSSFISNPKLKVLPYDNQCSYWLYTLHVLGGKRDEFINYLHENEIESSIVHSRCDKHTCTKAFYKELPGVSSFSETQVNIPLSVDNMDYIISKCNNF